MNWKQVNEAYPRAFLEWVNTKGRVKSDCVNLEFDRERSDACFFRDFDWNIRVVKRDDILTLPEYFDGLGIHVDTYQIDEAAKALREFAGLDTKHGYSVTVKSPNVWEGAMYATRRETLEAGVKEAFRIREEQLKQTEK